MKLVGPFLRLVRWPNLVFIAVTQCLFHFCVIKPSAHSQHFNFPLQLNSHLFVLLCISSVAIAAAGYIINDYFDINIDLVNKPEKMVVDKIISRLWALVWHLCSLSSACSLVVISAGGSTLAHRHFQPGVCIAALVLLHQL